MNVYLYNPLTFSFILVVVILFPIIYFFVKYYVPEKIKHNKEKDYIYRQSADALARLAEIDPNPLIRCVKDGKIEYANKAAITLFNFYEDTEYNIKNIEQLNIINPLNIIQNNTVFSNEIIYKYRNYILYATGINQLNILQITLHDITILKEQEKELVRNQNEIREFAHKLQGKIETERERIARDLHDSISNNMVITKMYLTSLNARLKESEVAEDVGKCLNLIHQTQIEIKNIINELKPILVEDGLHVAIKKLCLNVTESTGIEHEYMNVNLPKNIPNQTQIFIYRIIQEAINNIVKHSEANKFTIVTATDVSKIKIRIKDNGKGFNLNERMGKSHGLPGMQERVNNLNGELSIKTGTNIGTEILIFIPEKNNE